MEKLTFNFVEMEFRKHGCVLLVKEYKNNWTKMAYRCVCGNISSICWAHFRSGRRCKICGIKKRNKILRNKAALKRAAFKGLTQKLMKELFDYNQDTGILIWKKSIGRGASGDEAGNSCHGYRQVGINKKNYYTHRLIWLWYYGSLQCNEIDHINGITDDNRIKNLRDVTRKTNRKNQKLRYDNKSGVNGVSWQRNRWVAQISVDNKNTYLGKFKLKKDAINARHEAEKKYGFHPNHGKR